MFCLVLVCVNNEYSSVCACHSWAPVSYMQCCEWMFCILRIHLDGFNGSEHTIFKCRCVTEASQTAFGCAPNIRRTAKLYPPTVGTSKGIHIQHIYVRSIRCLGECGTVYKCTICSASPRFHKHRSHSRFDINPAYHDKIAEMWWGLICILFVCTYKTIQLISEILYPSGQFVVGIGYGTFVNSFPWARAYL